MSESNTVGASFSPGQTELLFTLLPTHSLVCADDVELGFAEFSSGKRENVLLWIYFFNGKIKPAKTLTP